MTLPDALATYNSVESVQGGVRASVSRLPDGTLLVLCIPETAGEDWWHDNAAEGGVSIVRGVDEADMWLFEREFAVDEATWAAAQ